MMDKPCGCIFRGSTLLKKVSTGHTYNCEWLVMCHRLEREKIRSWASKELSQDPRAASSLPPSSSVRPSSSPSSLGGLKSTAPSQRRPATTSSRVTKSPQRSFGLLGRGSGGGGKKSPSPRPPSLSSSKMADVQNWVTSTNAATMAQPLNHSPTGGK